MTASTSPGRVAARARSTGLCGLLGPGEGREGLAACGVLEIKGADAASFLQAQLTNDVAVLAPGQGCLNARVTRTGHLVAYGSLHAHPEASAEPVDRFLFLLEHPWLEVLADAFDQFLFSEEVDIRDATGDLQWVAIQGPAAPLVLEQALGLPEDGSWSSVSPCHARLVDGNLVIRRSLTGDLGYVLGLSSDWEPATFFETARQLGMVEVEPVVFSQAVDILRIEAGLPRLDTELSAKERLLPETGLEQQLVSYTKGCYLGQEVIARVRTYGSVASALRGLVLKGEADDLLDQLPAVGEDLVLSGGEVAGQVASRCHSPLLREAVALAYLKRAYHTPGTRLELEGGTVSIEVRLIPFYQAPDTAARVAFLYDRAVRVFAEGKEAAALATLEEALRLEPAFADGYELIGVILGRAGRYHEAIDFFRRLEEVAPHEAMVNTNLSITYMRLGDKTTAEEQSAIAAQKQFRQTRWQDQSTAEVAEEQAETRRKEAGRKRDMFAKVLAFDSEDAIALFGMGMALATLGRAEEARESLEKARGVDAKNSAVFLALGKVLESLDRNEDALEVYSEGMTVASNRGDLMPLKEMEHRKLLLQATRED